MAEVRADRHRGGRSAVMTMLYIVLGPSLWALHLFLIYGPQSLLCARGMPDAIAPIVGVATLVIAVPLVFAIAAPRPIARLMRAGGWVEPQQRFMDRVVQLLSVLSLFGVLAAGAAAFILPPC